MRKLKRLTALTLVLAVILPLGAYLLVSPASRAAVEKAGPYALGVETTLQDVGFSPGPSLSSLGFDGFRVENPEGVVGDPFLTIGTFEVAVETGSLLSKEISIPEIKLDGLHLNLIQDGTRSNYGEIVAHIRSLGTGEAKDPGEQPAPGSDPGPSLQVGRVSVADVAVSLAITGIPGLSPIHKNLSLPEFELDVGKALGQGQGNDEPESSSLGALTAVLVEELIQAGLDHAKAELDPDIAALLDGNLEGAIKARLEAEAEGVLDKAKDELRGELRGLLGGG